MQFRIPPVAPVIPIDPRERQNPEERRHKKRNDGGTKDFAALLQESIGRRKH